MELQKAIQEAGLDITQVLGSYQEFISNQLALPENSQISASEYSQLISNIRTLIVSELLELKSEIQDLKDDNDGEMTNMQWEINSILKDKLSNITDSLFPSAIFYINMSRKEISSQIINEQTKGTKGKLHA
jgi:predicted nuclease with TOPRIM domain